MSTAEAQILQKEIKLLRQEVFEIKEAFCGCLKDKEGIYKKGFVKEILSLARRKPVYRYNKKDFLKRIS